MRILAVGGGSGGHVTPVVAVLREIRKSQPNAQIQFWCDKKFARQAKSIMGHFDNSIAVKVVIAGKFRRFNHVSFLRQLFWPSVVLRNIRDLVYVVLGFFQSIFKLVVWRPNVVFAKGGYVCLPVGAAAHVLGIPIVIHDSDAHPGLTNRILSRWASAIATGAPLDNYSYPASISKYVGIPVAPEFHRFTKEEQLQARHKWTVNPKRPLIVITGGGLGARNINDAVVVSLKKMLELGSVVLISGSSNYDELRAITPPNSQDFQLHSFITQDMPSLLGAADVVVSRAGATFLVELAALAKPTILVPNAKLTGGHQLKNAKVYERKDAVVVIDEEKMISNPDLLVRAIEQVLQNPDKAMKMADNFEKFARPNAAKDVANMVISNAGGL